MTTAVRKQRVVDDELWNQVKARQLEMRRAASENEEGRTAARQAIRALINAIVLETDGDQLKITLKGDLAGLWRRQEVARYRRPRGPNTAGCGGGI